MFRPVMVVFIQVEESLSGPGPHKGMGPPSPTIGRRTFVNVLGGDDRLNGRHWNWYLSFHLNPRISGEGGGGGGQSAG